MICILICYLFFGRPEFLYEGGWEAALAYPLFHGNIFHLAANSIAIWFVYRCPCKPCRDLVIPYIISIAVYPLSGRALLGVSNMIYAAIGLRTPAFSSPWWRKTPVIVFLAVTLLMLFIPSLAGVTHIVSFSAGVLLAAAHRFWLYLTRDARRYL